MPQALISTWLGKPKQHNREDNVDKDYGYGLHQLQTGQGYFNKGAQIVEEKFTAKENRHDAKNDTGKSSSDVQSDSNPSRASKEELHVRSPKTHPRLSFQTLDEKILPKFKILNTILPVPYSERFYEEILTCPVTAAITMVAMWNPDSEQNCKSKSPPSLVSAIRCRLLRQGSLASVSANSSEKAANPTHTDAASPVLYISTLVTKPSFRSYGAATALLDKVTRIAVDMFGICAVEAHVWDRHENALEWYKRRGFVVVRRLEKYYTKLRPSGAVLVQKLVGS